MSTRLYFSFILACTLLSPALVHAEHRYFMVMFASESASRAPALSHSFAVFIKAGPEGDSGEPAGIETHCISWLPASLQIRLLRLAPEPGRNLRLHETLEWVDRLGARVTAWGPFAIKKELFDQAAEAANALDSGRISYIALDRRFRGNGATNCIHAIADIDKQAPLLLTGTAHGNAASAMLVRHLERWTTPEEVPDWVVERLGIDTAKVRFHTRKSTPQAEGIGSR